MTKKTFKLYDVGVWLGNWLHYTAQRCVLQVSYYGSNKYTRKETGKTRLRALYDA